MLTKHMDNLTYERDDAGHSNTNLIFSGIPENNTHTTTQKLYSKLSFTRRHRRQHNFPPKDLSWLNWNITNTKSS